MDKYVWLFPVIFMLHEMEEIIGFKFWLMQNGNMLKEKYPKIAKEYEGHSTEGFALAVAEEYIICLLICVLSIITGRYGLWFGGFIAYAIHLIVHIIQSAVYPCAGNKYPHPADKHLFHCKELWRAGLFGA